MVSWIDWDAISICTCDLACQFLRLLVHAVTIAAKRLEWTSPKQLFIAVMPVDVVTHELRRVAFEPATHATGEQVAGKRLVAYPLPTLQLVPALMWCRCGAELGHVDKELCRDGRYPTAC